ncbi:hypothetical protein M758_3G207200 [Ceratodon purpureus]|uniref:PX domain-containing protein n=1 Tax=Ceratodon purpureus TaxID=3225 RepID=A0A8T0IN29_CERPU|nr:hypothetical protein KC19_3G207400 [Ceratodon purpureus]KAG0623861.1 hypothetical protein M758_3G207200 [Ceratodon purpureus]
MMGSGEGNAQQARLYTSTDAMESLVLEDNPHSFLSTSDYRSAMSGGGSMVHEAHPLAASPEQPTGKFRDSFSKGFQNSGRSHSLRDTMIEPPSYADAIFSPYMGDDLNGSSPDLGIHSSPSFTSSPSSEFLSVRVSDPQKVPETGSSLVPGGSSYVTYKFSTHTNIPSYLGSEFCVKRRFRDVVTLADKLAESYRGYFIPPRPDKSVVDSQVMQKVEFIEQRRAALEKYLARLASHPVLRHSDELRIFLQAEGRLPLQPTPDIASRMLDGAVKLPLQLFGETSSMLSPQEAAQPARGRELLRMFKELKQSVTNDWSSGKPVVIEEDKEFLENKEKLTDLERQLSYASQQAETWVKGQQEVGEVMGNLGLTFIKLAKFETESTIVPCQRVFAADAKRTATAAVKASRFYRESNALSVKHLDELHEYLGLMQALHSAFLDRNNALITVQTLTTDVATLNKQIEKSVAASSKVFGGSKSQNRKTEELKESLKNTDEAYQLSHKQYDQIKDRNKAELKRFDEERNRDFMNMLQGLIQTQVGYSKKMANVWTKVAEEAAGSSNRTSEASSSGFSVLN